MNTFHYICHFLRMIKEQEITFIWSLNYDAADIFLFLNKCTEYSMSDIQQVCDVYARDLALLCVLMECRSDESHPTKDCLQYACLVINPSMVDNFAAHFNCTLVDWASDSMIAPT